MKNSILKIKDLVIDEKLYPRKKLKESLIDEYARDMRRGNIFPPLYVGIYKSKKYLIDGRHRLEAYRTNGEEYVQCEIKSNFVNFGDMVLAAYRANDKRGLRFSRDDKLKVAYTLHELKYDILDISKLIGFTIRKLNKEVFKKAKQVIFSQEKKEGKVPDVLKETLKREEKRGPLLSEEEEKKLAEEHKEEWQITQLEQILEYIKTEDFVIDNKQIENLLRRIKKWLHKRFPKL